MVLQITCTHLPSTHLPTYRAPSTHPHIHPPTPTLTHPHQNFIALVPLALLLGDITEDLAVRFGEAVGGLVNATFGNGAWLGGGACSQVN